MSEGPFPRTLEEAAPYITWGALVFTFMFIFVEKLVEGSYGQALFSFIGGLLVTAVALHSKTWLARTSPNYAFVAAATLALAVIFSPLIEQRASHFYLWTLIPIAFVSLALGGLIGYVVAAVRGRKSFPVVPAAHPAEMAIPTQKPKKHYAIADVEPLGRALRLLSGIVNDQGAHLLTDVRNFENGWRQKFSSSGADAVIADSAELGRAADALSQSIYDLEKNNEYYADEVRYVVNAPAGEFSCGIEITAKNFAMALKGAAQPPNSSTNMLLQPWIQALNVSGEDLRKRIEETKSRIQEFRTELDEAVRQ
jgi:hypothetical protein